MAKPTKYASLICFILTILSAIGCIWGLMVSSYLIPVVFLIPTIIYEVYRTEGESTTTASWILLTLFIGELIVIIFNIKFDLASFIGEGEKYIAGFSVPLGDLRIVFPVIMGIMSVVLFTRTAGIYTKWLSVIIFVTSLVILYITDPGMFQTILKLATNEALNRISI